jgi:peptidoglycan/LPS O-acetylase OafA/YrhL
MIRNLQILRAVAAYGVVVFHAQPFVARLHPISVHSQLGAAGVDIFFVISGFIMVYTSGHTRRTPLAFWRDRVIRIIPLYWLVLFAMIGVHAAGYRPSGLHQWDASDLVTSLFLLPNVRLDGVPEPILTPAWTLIYEMFFYLLFGMLLFIRSLLTITVLLTAIFSALWVFGLIYQPEDFAVRYYMNPILLEFAAGCFLGLIYLRSFESYKNTTAGWVLIGIGVASLILQDYYFGEAIFRTADVRLAHFGIPAIMIVAGALALENSEYKQEYRGILLLGSASYAMYLAHPLILHSVFVVSAKLLPANSIGSAVVFSFIAVLAVTAGSIIVHLWVEMPLTQFIKHRTRREFVEPKVLRIGT